MILTTLILTASLAFAQTAPTEPSASQEPMGTIDNVPANSAMSTREGTTPATPAITSNTANPATPNGYAVAPRENGFVPSLIWLIPLLVVAAVLFPIARRWSHRRDTDVSVRPRV